MAGRSAASSSYIYEWASNRTDAAPFVSEPEYRSRVVATIDFDESVDTQAFQRCCARTVWWTSIRTAHSAAISSESARSRA